ncbi:fungal-specific transcription factor domain-containing protein [Trichoderma barbatum]
MEAQIPKSGSQSSSVGQDPVVSSWSCFNCRRRKSRCNRQNPCAFCYKAGVECLYPSTGRMPTRQHNPTTSSITSHQTPQSRKRSEMQVQELLSRLKQLESVVDGMKAEAHDKDLPSRHTNLGNVSPGNSEPSSRVEREAASSGAHAMDSYHDLSHDLSRSFGSLHVCEGGTLYTSNGFWAALQGELRSVREAFETGDIFDLSHADESPPMHEVEADQMPFTFDETNPLESTLLPAPHLMSTIWKLYVENVDPFIKVLHVPTMSEVIQLFEGGVDKLSPGMRALLFSICLAAVASLSDSDVQETFGEAKEKVLSYFVLGTEKALSEAGILKTTDLCVAQASLIYLESAGHRYGMRTVWMMSGILVRAAISVGLHRDGATFPKVSYFEAEMRRRLWWHICCFDARVSQCYAPETIIPNSMLDAREPTNCNDADLEVNMIKEPTAREGFTDASFTLLACKLRRLCNYVLFSMPALLCSGEKQQAAQCEALSKIEEARQWATTNFFGDLGPRRAIQPFTDFFFGLLLDQLGIIVRDTDIFGRWASSEERELREQSFLSALALIENMQRWRDQSSTRQWSWVLVNFQQWYAIGIVLIHLQTQTWDSACERAWNMAVKALNEVPPAMMKQNPLRESIIAMVTATRQHREEGIAQQRYRLGSIHDISLLPEICASIPLPADLYSGSPGLELSAEFPVNTHTTGSKVPESLNIATVDILQENPFDSFVYPVQVNSEMICPPWCTESTSDLDAIEHSFGSLQDFFFL